MDAADRRLDKRKRKAAYRRQALAAAKFPRTAAGQQQGRLVPERRGLLITCNKRERECVGEAYDLLDAFLPPDEQLLLHGGPGDLDDDDNDDDNDMQRQIEKEKLASASRRKPALAPPAFEQLRTQVANCVFIAVSRPADRLPWIFGVTDSVFQAASAGDGRRRGVGGRHILRLLPVEATCASCLEDIEREFCRLWGAFAAAGEIKGDRPTFTVHFKARNFDKLDRQEVINRVFSAVKAATPAWSVNHDLADVVVDVNVLQKVTCISLLRQFRRYRKYNLSEVALGPCDSGRTGSAGGKKAGEAEMVEAAGAEKVEMAEAVGAEKVDMAEAAGAEKVEMAEATGAEKEEMAEAVGVEKVETAEAVGAEKEEMAEAVGAEKVEMAEAVRAEKAEAGASETVGAEEP